MSWLVRFFRQPSKRYRNFQIIFTILTLNFIIPAFSYTFTPHVAVAQFRHMNALLGGHVDPFPGEGIRLWRYLAAANVMTLGFMCLILQIDVKKFRMVVWPLAFMKAYAATMWLVGFIMAPNLPILLGAAALDYTSTFCFLFFAPRAYRDVEGRPAEELVPRPWSDRRAGGGAGAAPAAE